MPFDEIKYKQAAQVAADNIRQLTSVKGKPDYLGADHAIVWFNRAYPGGSIVPELLHLDTFDGRERAVFRTTIRMPDGGEFRGHGTETHGEHNEAGHHPEHIEKAETKSVRRALEHAGISLRMLAAIGMVDDGAPINTPPDDAAARGRGSNTAPRQDKPAAETPAASGAAKSGTQTKAELLASVPKPELESFTAWVHTGINDRTEITALYDGAEKMPWRWVVLIDAAPDVTAVNKTLNASQKAGVRSPIVSAAAADRVRALTGNGA